MTNTFDFSPLFRSTVGFDRLSRLLEAGTLGDSGAGYPPYNILKLDEDNYGITMAVAGFAEDDLEITTRENQLIVSGKASGSAVPEGAVYLHRGIAERAFERRFQLADHIRVTAAAMENGLLTISLVREIPEQMKPRKIEISSGADAGVKPKTISGKRSA
ncbi:MAG: Hsp20 family protein [Alphaproteobacteria bacterium]|nr:Hsp20 family protein [Alphaproteobacteria bacterium]